MWKAKAGPRLDTPIPIKQALQLHANLSKAESALLVQMRTEKIGLKDFLFNRRSRTPGAVVERDDKRSLTSFCAVISTENSGDKILARSQDRVTPGWFLNTRRPATKAIKFMEQTRILGHDRIQNV